MSIKSVCGIELGAAHELWLAMAKAGFTPTLAQLIISSPKNQLARVMLAAVEGHVLPPQKKQQKPQPKYHTAADGTITFSVTSDGTTGSQWIDRLKDVGHKVGDHAKQLLLSPDFVPTSGVTTKIVVLPGSLWTDSDRLTTNVRAAATDRTLVKPNAEGACLIRMMFTNEEISAMGLRWLVIMHEPIKDADGHPLLLTVYADDSESWLHAFWVNPVYQWYRQSGFGFAVPQV